MISEGLTRDYETYRNLMKYHKYWFIFFIVFIIFGFCWFTYLVISERTLHSFIWLIFYISILIINYKQIGRMRESYKKYERLCKGLLVESLENGN